MRLRFELDPDVNALYVRVRQGKVARTLEVDTLVYLDVDEEGQPLGLEFVNADDFVPFLRRHAGHVHFPEKVTEPLDALFTPAD